MRIVIFLTFLLLISCAKNEYQINEPAPQPVPVWEDVENSAYKFYCAVSKTLLRTNQPMEASRTIRRLIKLKPDSPEPYFLMGRAYMTMQQHESAIKMFNKSIDKDDEYADAYSMLGAALNTIGKHDKAMMAHLKAIDLDGENTQYRNNKGFGYYLQGDYEMAAESFCEALEIDPGASRIHNNLGFAFGKMARFEEAYRQFKLAGLPAQASNNMGFVYESAGELIMAYDYYALAIDQDPALIQAMKNLKRVCLKLGLPEPMFGEQPNEDQGDDEKETTSHKV